MIGKNWFLAFWNWDHQKFTELGKGEEFISIYKITLTHKRGNWGTQSLSGLSNAAQRVVTRSQSGVWSPEPNMSVPFQLKQGPLLLMISRYIWKILVRDHFCSLLLWWTFLSLVLIWENFPAHCSSKQRCQGSWSPFTGMLQTHTTQQEL